MIESSISGLIPELGSAYAKGAQIEIQIQTLPKDTIWPEPPFSPDTPRMSIVTLAEHAERKTTADGLSRRSVGGGAEHGLHSKLWDTLRCVTERRKRLVTTSGLHADACKV